MGKKSRSRKHRHHSTSSGGSVLDWKRTAIGLITDLISGGHPDAPPLNVREMDHHELDTMLRLCESHVYGPTEGEDVLEFSEQELQAALALPDDQLRAFLLAKERVPHGG